MAYFTIMSFFPLIALVIIVLAFFTDPAVFRTMLTDTLGYYFPVLTDLLGGVIEHPLLGSTAVGVIAGFGLIITAKGLFLAGNRSVNRIFAIQTKSAIRTTIA